MNFHEATCKAAGMLDGDGCAYVADTENSRARGRRPALVIKHDTETADQDTQEFLRTWSSCKGKSCHVSGEGSVQLHMYGQAGFNAARLWLPLGASERKNKRIQHVIDVGRLCGYAEDDLGFVRPDNWEALWLAGIIESDGHIQARIRAPRRTGLVVAVSVTDRDITERAAGIMGSSVRTAPDHRPNRQDRYAARVYGADAERVMQMIRPYMGQRKGAMIDEYLAMDLSHRPRRKAAS